MTSNSTQPALKLLHNKHRVWPDQPRRVTSDMLSVTSDDATPTELKFKITSTDAISFINNDTGKTITTFTQADIDKGIVTMVPTAGVPAFNFTITDGDHTIGPFRANILFNPQGIRYKSSIHVNEVDGKNGVEVWGDTAGIGIGWALGNGVDLDRDGRDELLFSSRSLSSPGSIYVVWGDEKFNDNRRVLRSRQLRAPQGFKIPTYRNGAGFGSNLDILSDFDNNGTSAFSCTTFSANPIVYGSEALRETSLLDLTKLTRAQGFILSGGLNGITWIRIGDINGDGIRDLVISPEGSRKAYVITDFEGLLAQQQGLQVDLTKLLPQHGFKIFIPTNRFSVDGIGDINGDKIDDFLTCNIYGNNEAGICYVVFGSRTLDLRIFNNNFHLLNGKNGFRLFAPTRLLGSYPNANTILGDTNGDGYGDFSVAEQIATPRGYILFGGKHVGASGSIDLSKLAQTKQGFVIHATDGTLRPAAALLGADVTGDGLNDIIVASATDKTRIIYGHPRIGVNGAVDVGQLKESEGVTIRGLQILTIKGGAIATGDYDGNGAIDWAFSSDQASTPELNRAGKVHVFFGATPETFSLAFGPLAIDPGETLQLTEQHINVTCLHSGFTPEDISLKPQNVEHARFELAANRGTAITKFTLSQVQHGDVVLVSTDLNTAPVFDMTMQAGFWETPSQHAQVEFVATTSTSTTTTTTTTTTTSTTTSTNTTTPHLTTTDGNITSTTLLPTTKNNVTTTLQASTTQSTTATDTEGEETKAPVNTSSTSFSTTHTTSSSSSSSSITFFSTPPPTELPNTTPAPPPSTNLPLPGPTESPPVNTGAALAIGLATGFGGLFILLLVVYLWWRGKSKKSRVMSLATDEERGRGLGMNGNPLYNGNNNNTSVTPDRTTYAVPGATADLFFIVAGNENLADDKRSGEPVVSHGRAWDQNLYPDMNSSSGTGGINGGIATTRFAAAGTPSDSPPQPVYKDWEEKGCYDTGGTSSQPQPYRPTRRRREPSPPRVTLRAAPEYVSVFPQRPPEPLPQDSTKTNGVDLRASTTA